VLAAACGGSKSSSSTTGTETRPTQQQFITAANAVCVRSDRAVYKLGRLSLAPTGWAKTAAAARHAVADMKKVTPSAGKDAAFQQMLDEGQKLAIGIQQVHDALVKSDLDTATAAQFAAAQIQDRVHTAAKTAGLTFCQQALTNWPA